MYKYSNQAWERLNTRLKTYYLQNSQRGGHGKNGNISSHSHPLARWLQRVLMWNTGLGEAYFTKNITPIILSNILLSDSTTSKALASDQSSDSSKFSLSGQNNVPSKNISNYSVNSSSDIPDSILSSDPALLPSSIPSSDQIVLAH